MMDKKKKIKILILVAVIIISAVGGYLFYSNHMNSNFEENLKEADGYAAERVDRNNEISADSQISFSTQKEGSRLITNIIKDINKMIKSLDNEINSLEEAKKYAQTPDEKKYIDLQLKLKNNYKKNFESYKKYYEYRVEENNIGMFSEAYENERNALVDKLTELNREDEKTIKEIGDLLKNNPDLKQKLKNIHLKDSYIGEINYL